MTQGVPPASTISPAYLKGYMAAAPRHTCPSGIGVVRLPNCPYDVATQDFRFWFDGAIDCVMDRAHCWVRPT